MFLSRDQVRELDRRAIDDYGMPGAVLMENAGRGAAHLLHSLGIHGSVAICCGKGNNGGDGFVMARHLDNYGASVRVLLFARPEELTGAALTHYRIVARSGLPISDFADQACIQGRLLGELRGAEWIVDALFGTGLQGPVRAPFDEVIATINRAKAHVLAVDIPSGLDCDSGAPMGITVRADHTATFVAAKKGFANHQAKSWLGLVHVIDIGVPRSLLESYRQPEDV